MLALVRPIKKAYICFEKKRYEILKNLFQNIFLKRETSLNDIEYQNAVDKVIIVCKQFQFQQRVLYQVTPAIILLLRFSVYFEFHR